MMRAFFAVLMFVWAPVVAIAVTNDFNVSITIGADMATPTIPAMVTATPISTSQIDLAWAASSDNIAVVGYRLYRDAAFIATTSALTYSDLGLAASTSYSYYVTAYDAADNRSASSTVVTTSTLPVIAPPANTGSQSTRIERAEFAATNWSQVVAPQSIRLTFDTNHPSYTTWDWGVTADRELGSAARTDARKSHTVTITDVQPGTTYIVRVRTVSSFDGSEVVRQFTLRTPPGVDTTAPPNVNDFRAVIREAGGVQLTWQNPAVSDFAYVRIVRKASFYPRDMADGWIVYEGSAAAVIDVLQPDPNSYYAIFAFDKNGNVSSGALAIVTAAADNISETDNPGETSPAAASSTTDIPSSTQPTTLDAPILIRQNDYTQDFQADTPTIWQSSVSVIAIPYTAFPPHLKTIVVTLTHPTDQTEFSFLLKANTNRTAYEAAIGQLPTTGVYQMEIAVYDFKEQQLSRYTDSFVVAAVPTERYEVVSPEQDLRWTIVPLLILLWLVYRASRRLF